MLLLPPPRRSAHHTPCGFVLLAHLRPPCGQLDCSSDAQDPSSFLCQGVTQFQGDNPNSTDLILSFSVEVDGEWGPYLPCNPRDPKHPEGPWVCDSNIGSPPLPQCKARFAIPLYLAACGYSGFMLPGSATVSAD